MSPLVTLISTTHRHRTTCIAQGAAGMPYQPWVDVELQQSAFHFSPQFTAYISILEPYHNFTRELKSCLELDTIHSINIADSYAYTVAFGIRNCRFPDFLLC